MRTAAIAFFIAARLHAQTLVFSDVAVSDIAGGLGVAPNHRFMAGDTVHLGFRVSGLELNEVTRTLRGEYTIEPVDCLGRLFVPPLSGRIERQLRTVRRDWSEPVRFAFEVPAMPWPGEAKFRISIRDLQAERTVMIEVPFEVDSTFSEPSEKLEISRLTWHRSQYDESPLPAGSGYRPGSDIWVRFALAGFRVGEKNRYDLRYGVALRNPSKRIIFEEQKAAAESRESFYSKTHVTALLGVTLERNIKPGAYVLLIKVADGIGNQQMNAEFPFEVSE